MDSQKPKKKKDSRIIMKENHKPQKEKQKKPRKNTKLTAKQGLRWQ